jgi:hypothetical protein
MHELTIKTLNELSQDEISAIADLIVSPKNLVVEFYRGEQFVSERFQHFSAVFPKPTDRLWAFPTSAIVGRPVWSWPRRTCAPGRQL